ncbi:unnamed protein product [Notodromas monacha]|uniref:Uncharacterized protein n=1 Tax=Notodromas monacha TaxID=399045 RepID=A0A7R9BDL4_9CRUS|nr:unnamed protein product [Notodromas monacha]CAG0912840.1 unnamed protein product [Notodromas monacha]
MPTTEPFRAFESRWWAVIMGIASLLVVLVGFLELPDVECEMLQVVRPLPVQKDDVVVTGQIGVSMGSEVLLAKPEACASPADNAQTSDCFETSPGSHWYGGGEQYRQPWPLELQERLNFPFVTGDMLQNETAFYGGLIERYFLNSRGMGIYISPDVPLFHTVTNGTLCFNGKVELPFKAPELELPSSNFLFKYDLCSAGIDPRETHVEMARKFISAPVSAPDERMIRAPIWSSWARFKENVNESVILAFAEEISSNGYPNAQVEIDDNWETCYGELSFDPEKFPDPARMIRDLNDMGYRTTVWVHPFMNSNCEQYPIASDAKYFILNGAKNQTAWSVWWKGFGGLVDFTNPRAVEWYEINFSSHFSHGLLRHVQFCATSMDLNILRETNGHRCRMRSEIVNPLMLPLFVKHAFIASEYTRPLDLLQQEMNTEHPSSGKFPDSYSRFTGRLEKLRAETGIDSFKFDAGEVNWIARDYSLFDATLMSQPEAFSTRYVDIVSHFGPMAEVRTGRRNQNAGIYFRMLDKLSVWGDANGLATLIPSLLHSNFIGYPFVLPDMIGGNGYSEEFLLGDSILVAPVLEEGETSRDIYLPRGRWEDQVSEDRPVYEGPITLENYPAPLDVLPYFIAVP